MIKIREYKKDDEQAIRDIFSAGICFVWKINGKCKKKYASLL